MPVGHGRVPGKAVVAGGVREFSYREYPAMAVLLLKALAIWAALVVMAIANAGIREKLLVPVIGPGAALPVSGLLLSTIILLVAYASLPLFGRTGGGMYVLVGVVWFVLTLAFELLFGHFVSGKTWQEVMQVFDIRKGDLFVIALSATLLAPWLAAKLRGWV